MSSTEDSRLSQLAAICLGFPEATRTDSGRHASFTVRRKTFAWFLDDHHRNGIVSVEPGRAGDAGEAGPPRGPQHGNLQEERA